jgi:hypothetical protein
MEDDAQTWAPLAEVAAAYGVSVDTIRRRIRRKELAARREQTPQGFRWLAPLPESVPDAPGAPRTHETPAHGSGIVAADDGREELIAALRDELANRVREVAELHEVIRAQAKALEVRAALPASSEAAAPSPATSAPSATPTEPAPPGLWARLRRVFGIS